MSAPAGIATAAPRRFRASIPLALTLLAACGIASASFLLGSPGGTSERRLLVSAHGKMALTNSKPDSAVVSATGLIPGETVKGRVAIGVDGTDAHLSVTQQLTTSTPGVYGGDIAPVLRVNINRPGARKAKNRMPVYDGPLIQMPRVGLGNVPAGAVRRYRISINFPDGGLPPSPTSGDNALQGAGAEVSFDWAAR